MIKGTLRKLKSELNSDTSAVNYWLPVGDEFVALNELVGKNLTLQFTGNIYCIDTGKKIKKSYGQGYSWESFITLAACDQCIFQPELCHYARGTCRQPRWGEEHCMQPHIVYLSLTSDLKVGITRKTQVPTRWIDQGAVKAIKLCEVKDRLTSGNVEVELAKTFGDKTNWRNMLKNQVEDQDLVKAKKEVLKKYAELFKKYDCQETDDEVFEFQYPVEKYPEKVSALNFDKKANVSGVLKGIKGQYLIFENGVINIRKFQGYEVEVEY